MEKSSEAVHVPKAVYQDKTCLMFSVRTHLPIFVACQALNLRAAAGAWPALDCSIRIGKHRPISRMQCQTS